MLKYYEDALAGIDKRIADGFAVRHHRSLRPALRHARCGRTAGAGGAARSRALSEGG